MATYIVIKRSRGDGWLPGDMLVDPPKAELVESRGYIRRVPDGYEPTEQESRPRRDSDAQLAADAAASDEAETSDDGEDGEGDDGDNEGDGDDSQQTDEVKPAKSKSRKKADSARPDAEALAKAMEVSVDEVLGLPDEDYNAGLQAYELAGK